ncbi:hypothetical protein KY495_05620 [Massilia sp. PAMC28688]|uniref:hypothetical protein n=1 Tax=Massilia sp. PAMC28688 TaxID=2861283 RepID=UPI001C62E42D|nr:hypothetical protein [Massilia sp. PAMC28688]QYF94675.1 hypothetical protein KY495_05620 [Massilia sp. PAMC28688]
MKISLPLIARLCGAMVLASASVACSGVSGNGEAPATAAPAAAAPAPAPVVAAAPAGTARSRLMAEIGDAACDTAQQCKTVPVGSKACGGPEGYLAYSTKRSDSAKVARLAAEDAAQRKEQDQRSGMISNCMMLMDPGATCSAGRCVTAKPGAVAS